MNCWQDNNMWIVQLIVVLLFVVTGDVEPRMSGFYADNDITGQTVLIDVLPGGTSRRAIKREILHVLGLERRPRPGQQKKNDAAPHYMLDLYKQLQLVEEELEEEEERYIQRQRDRRQRGKNYPESRHRRHLGNLTLPEMEQQVTSADIIMTFKNEESREEEKTHHESDRRMYFDLSRVPEDQDLLGAELRLYKNAANTPSRFYKLTFYRFVKNDLDDSLSLEYITSIQVVAGLTGWVDVNLTNLVLRWVLHKSENHGLYLTVADDQGVDVRPGEAGLTMGYLGLESQQPFLVGFFRTNPQRPQKRRRKNRSKRAVTYNDADRVDSWDPYTPKFVRSASSRPCQKRALVVSFKELGWQEWIIAPSEYSAFYCDGECSFPLNVHMNATNHAIVQTLAHLTSPTEVPKPSCAPTRLSAATVLFFDDDNNVILKKYRNMIARSCGCH